MLHHVEIYVRDIKKSHTFWVSVLERIGYQQTANWGEGFTLSNDKDAYLTFVQVSPKHADLPYHRSGVGLNHLAFQAGSRKTVDVLRDFCLKSGYTCLYDERYPFANGGTDYYALFVEDPDRIKVEFVASESTDTDGSTN